MTHQQIPLFQTPEFAEDSLQGASAIAEYIYGSGDKKHRRKVYHLAATSQLPVFRMGSRLWARRSTIDEWVKKQEHRTQPTPEVADRPQSVDASQILPTLCEVCAKKWLLATGADVPNA